MSRYNEVDRADSINCTDCLSHHRLYLAYTRFEWQSRLPDRSINYRLCAGSIQHYLQQLINQRSVLVQNEK